MTNFINFRFILNSSLCPVMPIFSGALSGRSTTKWRGSATEFTFNPYLRNGWLVIDTGVKGSSGTPIIEFSTWQASKSTNHITLPNTISYKFFTIHQDWRASYLARTSVEAHENWVMGGLEIPGFLNSYAAWRSGFLGRSNFFNLPIFSSTVVLRDLVSRGFFAKNLNLNSSLSNLTVGLATNSVYAAVANRRLSLKFLKKIQNYYWGLSNAQVSDNFFLATFAVVYKAKSFTYFTHSFTSFIKQRIRLSPAMLLVGPSSSIKSFCTFNTFSEFLFKFNFLVLLCAAFLKIESFRLVARTLISDILGALISVLFYANLKKRAASYTSNFVAIQRFLISRSFFLLAKSKLSPSNLSKLIISFIVNFLSKLFFFRRTLPPVILSKGLSSANASLLLPYRFKRLYLSGLYSVSAQKTVLAGSSSVTDTRAKFFSNYLKVRTKWSDKLRKYLTRRPRNKYFFTAPKRKFKRNKEKKVKWYFRGWNKVTSFFKFFSERKQFFFVSFWTFNFFNLSLTERSGKSRRLFLRTLRLIHFFKKFFSFFKFYAFYFNLLRFMMTFSTRGSKLKPFYSHFRNNLNAFLWVLHVKFWRLLRTFYSLSKKFFLLRWRKVLTHFSHSKIFTKKINGYFQAKPLFKRQTLRLSKNISDTPAVSSQALSLILTKSYASFLKFARIQELQNGTHFNRTYLQFLLFFRKKANMLLVARARTQFLSNLSVTRSQAFFAEEGFDFGKFKLALKPSLSAFFPNGASLNHTRFNLSQLRRICFKLRRKGSRLLSILRKQPAPLQHDYYRFFLTLSEIFRTLTSSYSSRSSALKIERSLRFYRKLTNYPFWSRWSNVNPQTPVMRLIASYALASTVTGRLTVGLRSDFKKFFRFNFLNKKRSRKGLIRFSKMGMINSSFVKNKKTHVSPLFVTDFGSKVLLRLAILRANFSQLKNLLQIAKKRRIMGLVRYSFSSLNVIYAENVRTPIFNNELCLKILPNPNLSLASFLNFEGGVAAQLELLKSGFGVERLSGASLKWLLGNKRWSSFNLAHFQVPQNSTTYLDFSKSNFCGYPKSLKNDAYVLSTNSLLVNYRLELGGMLRSANIINTLLSTYSGVFSTFGGIRTEIAFLAARALVSNIAFYCSTLMTTSFIFVPQTIRAVMATFQVEQKSRLSLIKSTSLLRSLNVADACLKLPGHLTKNLNYWGFFLKRSVNAAPLTSRNLNVYNAFKLLKNTPSFHTLRNLPLFQSSENSSSLFNRMVLTQLFFKKYFSWVYWFSVANRAARFKKKLLAHPRRLRRHVLRLSRLRRIRLAKSLRFRKKKRLVFLKLLRKRKKLISRNSTRKLFKRCALIKHANPKAFTKLMELRAFRRLSKRLFAQSRIFTRRVFGRNIRKPSLRPNYRRLFAGTQFFSKIRPKLRYISRKHKLPSILYNTRASFLFDSPVIASAAIKSLKQVFAKNSRIQSALNFGRRIRKYNRLAYYTSCLRYVGRVRKIPFFAKKTYLSVFFKKLALKITNTRALKSRRLLDAQRVIFRGVRSAPKLLLAANARKMGILPRSKKSLNSFKRKPYNKYKRIFYNKNNRRIANFARNGNKFGFRKKNNRRIANFARNGNKFGVHKKNNRRIANFARNGNKFSRNLRTKRKLNPTALRHAYYVRAQKRNKYKRNRGKYWLTFAERKALKFKRAQAWANSKKRKEGKPRLASLKRTPAQIPSIFSRNNSNSMELQWDFKTAKFKFLNIRRMFKVFRKIRFAFKNNTAALFVFYYRWKRKRKRILLRAWRRSKIFRRIKKARKFYLKRLFLKRLQITLVRKFARNFLKLQLLSQSPNFISAKSILSASVLTARKLPNFNSITLFNLVVRKLLSRTYSVYLAKKFALRFNLFRNLRFQFIFKFINVFFKKTFLFFAKFSMFSKTSFFYANSFLFFANNLSPRMYDINDFHCVLSSSALTSAYPNFFVNSLRGVSFVAQRSEKLQESKFFTFFDLTSLMPGFSSSALLSSSEVTFNAFLTVPCVRIWARTSQTFGKSSKLSRLLVMGRVSSYLKPQRISFRFTLRRARKIRDMRCKDTKIVRKLAFVSKRIRFQEAARPASSDSFKFIKKLKNLPLRARLAVYAPLVRLLASTMKVRKKRSISSALKLRTYRRVLSRNFWNLRRTKLRKSIKNLALTSATLRRNHKIRKTLSRYKSRLNLHFSKKNKIFLRKSDVLQDKVRKARRFFYRAAQKSKFLRRDFTLTRVTNRFVIRSKFYQRHKRSFLPRYFGLRKLKRHVANRRSRFRWLTARSRARLKSTLALRVGKLIRLIASSKGVKRRFRWRF